MNYFVLLFNLVDAPDQLFKVYCHVSQQQMRPLLDQEHAFDSFDHFAILTLIFDL